ncbi:urease accessory protein UreE [Flavobacterium sp. ALD4]|jgi:urease accessory protein|uniref:urease accessory protein UreE n=1 Tax=Flavobacterium sp. ALD4 TaxID=2058314 RepID=UPI000C31CE73|nr:urease accessory protein UreE [Flavobacterium sp. ALD4]PKH66954.1 urease accessory protein UreE [Flavobacterium sp. ALD4]
MIITTKIKHEVLCIGLKVAILIDFEWFETSKRIQHKTARDGKIFRLKFLNENPNLKQDEILHQEGDINYLVNILPCDCLVIIPKNNFETASICYEIGNKHLPLFYEEEALLVPLEKPLFRQLTAMGFEVYEQKRALLTPLRTSVAPHGESGTLFSKIMNLTQK